MSPDVTIELRKDVLGSWSDIQARSDLEFIETSREWWGVDGEFEIIGMPSCELVYGEARIGNETFSYQMDVYDSMVVLHIKGMVCANNFESVSLIVEEAFGPYMMERPSQ